MSGIYWIRNWIGVAFLHSFSVDHENPIILPKPSNMNTPEAMDDTDS
jgi:hypothetical protein